MYEIINGTFVDSAGARSVQSRLRVSLDLRLSSILLQLFCHDFEALWQLKHFWISLSLLDCTACF